MAIIDEELFVRCVRCGNEAATGIRRTETGLRERPPGERRITCHRCGHVAAYADGAFYHRTVEADRDRVDVRP
jgi:DNA-directed RNA polymerase subunit RPC12/RpoP